MLLSMYVSYHLAKTGKKSYILMMVVLVTLFSFLPAISPFPLGIFLPFPTLVGPVLSFPFYAWHGDTLNAVFFLTVTLIQTNEPSWADFFPFVPFPVFLLVNSVGAVLGYAMSKTRRIREWGTRIRWNLLGAALGVTFLGSAFLGFAFLAMEAALFLFGIVILAIVIGRTLWSKIQ